MFIAKSHWKSSRKHNNHLYINGTQNNNNYAALKTDNGWSCLINALVVMHQKSTWSNDQPGLREKMINCDQSESSMINLKVKGKYEHLKNSASLISIFHQNYAKKLKNYDW